MNELGREFKVYRCGMDFKYFYQIWKSLNFLPNLEVNSSFTRHRAPTLTAGTTVLKEKVYSIYCSPVSTVVSLTD